jgi:urocanate reductase
MEQATRRQFVQGAALGMAGVAAAGVATNAKAAESSAADTTDETWDFEADVVVVGSGGSGLPAALKASDEGASVIVVETNWDCGGHCMVSEGILPIGGGTSMQKKYGIEDSTDQFYLDHTQGTHPLPIYNDRDFERAITRVMPEVYDYIQEKGVLIIDREPESFVEGGWNGCDSVARWTYPDAETEGWVGMFDKDDTGRGIARPLERAARQQGVQFLMNYHMDKLFREDNDGRVYGLEASYTPHIFPGETEPKVNLMTDGNLEFSGDTCRIKANKGIILATGGSTGNLALRTAYDPRLGPEFDSIGGMPYSDADGSGEIAAMEVGAILGDMITYIQPEGGHAMSPAKRVGCRHVYSGGYNRTSVLWPLEVATGVIRDPDSMIIVNMLGARCGNEDIAWNGSDAFAIEWFNTSLASVVIDDPDTDGDAKRLAGPLWAIFDQACADRNGWDMEQGLVDYDNGYCFKADTLEELAATVVNKYYEDIKMDADTLVATVQAYNDAVDSGTDEEWGRTTLVNKIETGPFYAAWATNVLHDCYGGVRVAPNMQAVDIHGNYIEGLYACGESAGGTRTHGLSRAIPTGYIAGASAAGGGESGALIVPPENWKEMAVYGGAPEEKSDASADASAPLNDGTWTGTSSSGHDGPISVSVTVEGGVITAVEVTKENETETIGHAALPTLVDEVVAAGSTDIETVAGATTTSKAFIEAVNDALAKARE